MRMLRKYLRMELDEINRQNIRFQTIGRIEALAPTVRSEIARASERTATNTGMVLSVALNYGGRAEIVDACRAAMQEIIREGKSVDLGGRSEEHTSELQSRPHLVCRLLLVKNKPTRRHARYTVNPRIST